MPDNRRIRDIYDMGDDDFKKATYAIEVRRYDLAIEILHRILSTQPENSMAFYTLARAYLLKKQNEKALEAIRETLRLDASNGYAHTFYGSVLMQTGEEHYTQGEEELQAGVSLDPMNVYSHYVYALCLLDYKKDSVKAQEHCAKALELDPADVKHHWLMGQIFMGNEDFAQAEATFLHGLTLDPENARIHNSYGALLFNQQRRAHDAFEHFKIALAQEPEEPDYRKNFLLALKAKNKFYGLFWHHSLMSRKLGNFYFLMTICVAGLIQIILEMIQHAKPALALLAGTFLLPFLLFYLYMLTINPIFNFLIKRGWIK